MGDPWFKSRPRKQFRASSLSTVFLLSSNALADETWTYCVEISATVQASPPQITLHWQNDDIYGVTNFTIYRKAKDAASWNFLANLNGSTFTWTDPNVSVGST